MTYSDGSVYEGKMVNDKREGKGVMTWPKERDAKEAASYDGEFKNDKRHGTGKYTWGNGTYYIGGWSEGKRHGEGKMFYKGADD